MSFRDLYNFCQALQAPISRKVLVPRVCDLAKCSEPLICADGKIDTARLRGYFVRPDSGDAKYARFCRPDRPVIVFARGQGEEWERFVVVKELMHLFDDPLETVSTAAEFDGLLEEFTAPATDGMSSAFRSENVCYWRALAVFCPEATRQELERDVKKDPAQLEQAAKQLKLPQEITINLFRSSFKQIVQMLICK